MKAPKLAIAIGYIDDDLISSAVEYKPSPAPMRLFWFRCVAVAACLCLVVLGAVQITIGLLPDPDANAPDLEPDSDANSETPVSDPSPSNAPVYGVLAEVVRILDNGRYEVRITGEDRNFANSDIVIINHDYNNDESTVNILKVGDIIEITYSAFEKTGEVYEITPGQIHIVQSAND